MSVECFFCKGPVNPHDISTWKQVAGWVGGERKDSMTMRDDTGEYAHSACVERAKSGQDAKQPTIFDRPVDNVYVVPDGSLNDFEGLMADDAGLPVTSDEDRKNLKDLLG